MVLVRHEEDLEGQPLG